VLFDDLKTIALESAILNAASAKSRVVYQPFLKEILNQMTDGFMRSCTPDYRRLLVHVKRYTILTYFLLTRNVKTILKKIEK